MTGSYERALYGVVAHIPSENTSGSSKSDAATFSPSFLFNAHASSIRCLAVSPTTESNNIRLLATGGSDEKINVYQLSASAPPQTKAGNFDLAQSINRELGALLHHASTVTSLSFPSYGKLVSASLDKTIAISRIRDWTVLSSIKVPIPKALGRPSGDTAAPGEVPAGINDVAIHPSTKLAISVGQGEKCMRLWNLITGKRAGVLTFDRKTLSALGETRWRGGEGRSLIWSPDGEQFAVGFERGALIYGLDCTIRGMVKVSDSKVCRLRYVPVEAKASRSSWSLALSTEDGRVLFYESRNQAPCPAETPKDKTSEQPSAAPSLPIVAQLGEQKRGDRIKDFAIMPLPGTTLLHVVTGSSDGSVKLWRMDQADFKSESISANESKKTKTNGAKTGPSTQDSGRSKIPSAVGALLGAHETNKRITCLEAFVMNAASTEGAQEANGDRQNGDHLKGVASLASSSDYDFEGFDDQDVPAAEA